MSQNCLVWGNPATHIHAQCQEQYEYVSGVRVKETHGRKMCGGRGHRAHFTERQTEVLQAEWLLLEPGSLNQDCHSLIYKNQGPLKGHPARITTVGHLLIFIHPSIHHFQSAPRAPPEDVS